MCGRFRGRIFRSCRLIPRRAVSALLEGFDRRRGDARSQRYRVKRMRTNRSTTMLDTIPPRLCCDTATNAAKLTAELGEKAKPSSCLGGSVGCK
jgi:hypothetical protein